MYARYLLVNEARARVPRDIIYMALYVGALLLLYRFRDEGRPGTGEIIVVTPGIVW